MTTPTLGSAPNLFEHATSELSQEAWFCWLFAHVGRDDLPELRDAANDLVVTIWNGARSADPITASDVGGPVVIRRQAKRIDVLIELRVRGAPAVLLVEDKAESHHSEQLARYRKNVEERYAGAVVLPIHLETGYQFETELEASTAGYHVVALEPMLRTLESHFESVKSDVFRELVRFHRGALAARTTAIGALDRPEGHAQLEHDYVQHAFLTRLIAAAKAPGDLELLRRGTHPNGGAWSHWKFAKGEDLPGRIGESLYHRIDARPDANGVRRHCLSTQQYAKVKDSSEGRAAKLERLARYRQMFHEAQKESELPFATPAADHRGANESDIGVLFFDDGASSTANVLERFGRTHRAFVDRLRG